MKYGPLKKKIPEYKPGRIKASEKTGRQQIVLLTDVRHEDLNLNRMIDVFLQVMPQPVKVININSLNIKGGCLGCVRCGYNNQCVYNDDIRSVYQDNLMTADAIVFAGTVQHQFLSARWKMFLDRLFYNGHCPKLKGRKALVTGASRGLGYATARGLSLEGAEAAISSRSKENIEKAAKTLSEESNLQVHPLVGDLTDPNTPEKIW